MVDFQVYNSVTHPKLDDNDDIQMKDHAFEKTASYIIRKNGSYYEAIQGGGNTGAGTIAFGGSGNAGIIDGTDCGAVLEACATTNSVVQFAPSTTGTYTFKNPVVITDKDNFVIKGVGRGSYQLLQQGQTTFIKEFNDDFLTITYTGDLAKHSFGLEDFAVYSDPTTYSGGGIVIGDASFGPYWFWMNNVAINKMAGSGLTVTNGHVHRLQNVVVSEVVAGYGIYYDSCFDWQWYYVEVDTNNQTATYAAARLDNSHGHILGGHFEGWRGLDIRAGTGSSSVMADSIYIPYSKERGIYLGAGNLFSLSNSKISGANDGAGFATTAASTIYLDSEARLVNNYIGAIGDSATYSVYANTGNQAFTNNNCMLPTYFGTGNRLVNNYFYDDLEAVSYNTLTSNIIVGDLTSTGGHNRFVANSFSASPTLAGTDNSYVANIGFVTDSVGSFSVADGGWVNHNCIGAPTVVVSSLEASIQVFVVGWTATQFQVRFINRSDGTTPVGAHTGNFFAHYDP
jgi:hypothetical protein